MWPATAGSVKPAACQIQVVNVNKSAFACAAALLLLWTGPADRLAAQERPKRFTLWDINLGDSATAIPNEYVNYACGTNGGPPSIPLPDFAAFRKCKPDSMGLHEVYFEYDDELEYQARALDIKPEVRMYAGTTVFEFPIVASILFDDDGKVRGERAVTDPRQQVSRKREEFWELGTFLRQRFGDAAWKCVDLPPAEGENPVGVEFIKSNCEKTIGGARLIVEQRFLQKKGQEAIDPVTGKPNLQAFESSTRFEEYDASLPPPVAGSK
jgi:hypothetical protein